MGVFSDILLSEEEKIPRQKYMEMYDAVGAAMTVYNVLHRGMEEAIYQEALEMEFQHQNIPYEREKPLNTWYRGIKMKKVYYADFVAFEDIIIELKSVTEINSDHRAQLFNYMRITKSKCGMLINYGSTHFYCERYWYVERLDDFIMVRKDNLDYLVKK